VSEWTGDPNDDCALSRYGLTAHVECMDRGHWWFCIYRGKWPDEVQIYNTADNLAVVKLTTGKMARAAAECVMELLHSQPNE
jgi:hypothetical protein